MIITYAKAAGYVIDLHRTLVNPYVPTAPITKAIISADASVRLRESFKIKGVQLYFTEPLETLPLPLSKHADMQMVNTGEGVFVYAPGTSRYILEKLKDLGYQTVQGATIPGNFYPHDVAYNCAIVGRHAFLNPRYSDSKLLETLKNCGKTIIPVRQGYAKCSVCVMSNEAIITADASIHAKAVEKGIDSLLIPAQRNIVLPGYDYGFIGGSSGMISGQELALFGSFEKLADCNNIRKFLSKHGVSPVSMTDENLVDLGGVIPLCSV